MLNPPNQAIMIWLAYFIYGFIILRFMVSMINLLTGQWLKTAVRGYHVHSPLISVLIPARNEGSNIGLILSDLLQQDYANFEVLVYDDLSTDNTLQVIKEFTLKDPRIKLLKGLSLPEGWLGKNHACHRLSGRAAGEYLLFMDADVRLKKSLLTNSLAHAVRHRLDMMSIFPVQKMYTFGEKITVPVMNWVLLGLLPLILTRISHWPSFSAANGQFMLFRAITYHDYKFHKQLKHDMAEDIAIFRKMKKNGLRTHTVLRNGDVSCRMYRSWHESIEGFAKNVIDFFGGYSFMAIHFAFLTGLGFIPVILTLPWKFVIAFFVLSILTRAVISLISRQSPVDNLVFAPLQQISLFIMIIKALIHKKQHSLKWKGRKVYNEEPVSI